MILDVLHSLPNLTVGLFVGLSGLSVTTLIPYTIRRYYKLEPSEHVAKGAEESFKLFTSLTLLLLAFCLVRVQGDHRSAEDLAAREGTLIVKLDKALTGFGSDESRAGRLLLSRYAKSIVTDEWPLLSIRERSSKTGETLNRLSEVCKQLEPKTPAQQVARGEIVTSIVQLSDLREARLSIMHLQLPGYYWGAILTAMGVLTVFGWVQVPLNKMLFYVGGVTCGLSLLLTVLIVVEGIYVGESRVQPEPIDRAIELLLP